ncbi:RNA-binding protein RO60 isoform X2 [Brachyhypopomus gauderio]|uniref:RNA-binding protein RO60 isoform X2 n=1 Tax=Brachyhypopomus gauderio TaxID=698409 RepID=UPI00404172CB
MDASSPQDQTSDAREPDLENSGKVGPIWAVTEAVRLRRFLCYGSEGATYSTKEPSLTPENALALVQLAEGGRGCEVVEEVRRLCVCGGAVRPNAGLLALAVCSQRADGRAKRAALQALGELCRGPAQLFTFVQYRKELTGAERGGMWGRALRKAVANWYNGQDALRLAHTVTRCKHKAGWSHQDLFRLSHIKPANDAVALISKYVTKGWKAVQETYANWENAEELMKVFAYLEAVEKAKHLTDELEVVHLIEEHKLEREQILTNHLKSKEVWKALLKDMPVSCLMRHLGKMTADRVLIPGSPDVVAVCERIQDEQALMKTKTHPFSVLVASENYKRGHGKRGKLKWDPNSDVVRALDCAFCKCLSSVEPTGRRFVVGVDVSARLGSLALGSFVSTVAVAAAMSMAIVHGEAEAEVLVFSEGAMVPCAISANASITQVMAQLVQARSSTTDCSLPILWAADNHKMVDVFIVFTNNETWFGRANPAETLRMYRQVENCCILQVDCVWNDDQWPFCC